MVRLPCAVSGLSLSNFIDYRFRTLFTIASEVFHYLDSNLSASTSNEFRFTVVIVRFVCRTDFVLR